MDVAELEQSLRKRLQDDRWSIPAFVISCEDRYATDMLLDVGTHFRSTIINGNAPELVLDLSSAPYRRVGLLVGYLRQNHRTTYTVTPDASMDSEHASLDLEPVKSASLKTPGVELRTRRFSDTELRDLLNEGLNRHNPSLTLEGIPPGEVHLVILLAHAAGLRVMATNAAKRRGIEADAGQLLQLSESFEATYRADIRRLAKALSPLRTEDDSVRDGDVVVGDFSRFSLRTGTASPTFAKRQPHPPKLLEPLAVDTEDFSVTLRWRRSREAFQGQMELWRDRSPNVLRSRDASIAQTTSKQVWSSRADSNTNTRESWGVVDGISVEGHRDGFSLPSADQAIPADPMALEPGATYYYRLYLVDLNGEWVASEVVPVTLRGVRAMFTRTVGATKVTPVTGPRAGGTTITINGSNFSANRPKVFVGDVECTNVVYVSDVQLTADTPATHAYTTPIRDVTLVSQPSKLRDVYPSAWTYS